MMKTRLAGPIDAARIRRIEGSFSWIDHRFIPMMAELSRNENLLYLWLVAVGDRCGLSFYSDEKTASRIKIAVGEIEAARRALIAKGFIAYRDGVSQVLSLPGGGENAFSGGNHVIERGTHATGQVSERCRRAVVSADLEADRNLSKRIVRDILRQLEGT